MLREQTPVPFVEFNGLFGRGNDEQCPLDHFITSLNLDYTKGDVRTRKGSALAFTLGSISRVHLFNKVGEATRVIALVYTGGIGYLYDVTISLVTPILQLSGMVDFSLFTYYNRAYITPHNGVTGLPGEAVYVYNGTTCRLAAGAAPEGTLFAALDQEGNCEEGARYFAVAYETDSGYITKPGPIIGGYPWVQCPGGRSIEISNIPIGPSGTVARHIFTTPVTLDYAPAGGPSLPQDSYELFYVPNGRIPNNTDTELIVSFFDNELVSSADDLLDQYTEIPAGVGFTDYNSRLIVFGIQGEDAVALVSKQGEPESISAVDGLIQTDPKDSSGIKICREFRGQLYLFKSLQCYTTQDNGDTPDTWNVTNVDKGVGSEPYGIATVLDAKGSTADALLVVNRAGINLFNGAVVLPELTWKIEAWWKRINKVNFYKTQIILDQLNHLIYVAVPLDDATTPSHLFVGYYPNTFSASELKWTVWQFDHDPTSISVDVDFNTLAVVFYYASIEGNIYKLSDSATSDNRIAFTSTLQFPFIPSVNDDGKLWQVGGIRARVKGSGVLQMSLKDPDAAQTVNLASLTLSAAPGMELARQCNFTHERSSLTITMTSIDEYFILTKMVEFVQPVWGERPA